MNNHKVHIVFVPENKHWGGSELLWSKTALWLAKQNILVTVLKHERLKLPLWFVKESNNLDFLNIISSSKPKLSLIKRIWNRFVPYRFRFKAKNTRFSELAKIQPSLVVINQGFNFNGVITAIELNKLQIPYATISEAVNEGMWPILSLRENMKLAFKESVMNYFVSQDNLEVTQMQLGCVLDNTEIVRHPFNVPFKSKNNYPKNQKLCLAVVGRYHFSSKGQDVILRVLNQEKWKEREIQVNFYGSGDDIYNLKDVVSNFNLSNVKINEYTETSKIWENNHGLLLTSRYEGLPISIVEAMLSKRLVITTNVSGNKELLIDNENAFIAAAPRPEYVDEALERAWERRWEWKAMGEQAYSHIIQHIPEQPDNVFGEKLLELLK